MNSQGKRLLELLFNPGEHVYAQPNKYSSSWDDEKSDWAYHLPSVPVEQAPMSTTTLISVNPCRGDTRSDENVTAYRSFLVEMDDGSLEEQQAYVKASGLPYSACVFSGGRSLHFVVALDRDFPTKELYVFYAKWLLATLPKADQNNYPPSRATRFPGVVRQETGKRQILVDSSARVSYERFMAYLTRHRDKMPEPERRDEDFVPRLHNKDAMRDWVLLGLSQGFDFSKGRNQTWFAVGFEFCKCGYSLEEAVEVCEPQFVEERDFRRREWMACLKNGYKKAHRKYWRHE